MLKGNMIVYWEPHKTDEKNLWVRGKKITKEHSQLGVVRFDSLFFKLSYTFGRQL